MSQKTVRKASTSAASNIATVVPSKRPPFWRQTPPEYQTRGAAVPGSPACHIHPPPAYWRSSNSPLICATAWAERWLRLFRQVRQKRFPAGEARMMPHRQMTTTTAITTPPPAVAAAARALAAAITARSARFAAGAVPGGLHGPPSRPFGFVPVWLPPPPHGEPALVPETLYRRFPTRLSNSSCFANGMASRFDRHTSFFYCRLCGAAHSLPGDLRMRLGLHMITTCLPGHLPQLLAGLYTLWPFSRGRSRHGAVLSHRQAPLQFPTAEKVALALLHKGRFSLLQGAWRCGRCGIGLHLQIGVLGLDVSFLRRLECGLRLWWFFCPHSAPEWSSCFLPVKAVLWRQNTVISWPCCSWRIVTARVSVRACVRGMFCAFFSLSLRDARPAAPPV